MRMYSKLTWIQFTRHSKKKNTRQPINLIERDLWFVYKANWKNSSISHRHPRRVTLSIQKNKNHTHRHTVYFWCECARSVICTLFLSVSNFYCLPFSIISGNGTIGPKNKCVDPAITNRSSVVNKRTEFLVALGNLAKETAGKKNNREEENTKKSSPCKFQLPALQHCSGRFTFGHLLITCLCIVCVCVLVWPCV